MENLLGLNMRINCFGDKVSSLHCKIVLLDEQQLVHEVLVSSTLLYSTSTSSCCISHISFVVVVIIRFLSLCAISFTKTFGKRRAFILFCLLCRVTAFKIRFGRGLCYGTVTIEWTLQSLFLSIVHLFRAWLLLLLVEGRGADDPRRVLSGEIDRNNDIFVFENSERKKKERAD